MEALLGIISAFTQHVDLAHVLVLNLIGWMFKGCMYHSDRLRSWTDIIPLPLAVMGVVLAVIQPNMQVYHPIFQGLANAGLAWIIHQGVKQTQTQVKQYKDYKTQKIKTLKSQRGTGDGTQK